MSRLSDVMTKEELEKRYINEGLSATKIAEIYNIEPKDIYNAVKLFGLKKQKSKNYIKNNKTITKEGLIEEYIKNNISAPNIAKRFGVHVSTVYNLLDSFGIKKYDAINLKKSRLTEDILKQRYLVENCTVKELSVEFNLSKSSIHRLLNKFSIVKNLQMDENGKYRKSIITKDMLYEKYIVEKFRVKDLALFFQVSLSSITELLNKFKIRSTDNTEDLISDQVLVEEYELNKKSMRQICDEYAIKSTNSVKTRLKNLGIKRRSSGYATKERRKQWGLLAKGYKDINGSYWCSLKSKADSRNLCFELDIKDVWGLWILQDKKCALSGVELKLLKKRSYALKNKKEQTASLDRIDSSKGYTIDNVQWIHKDLQKVKWELLNEELFNWCDLIYNNLKEKYK